MKASKSQIISGIISYAENELIPKIEDKPTQVLASTAAILIKANRNLLDPAFEHPAVKMLLAQDENGMFEIDGLFDALEESVRKYDGLPLKLPTIPVISPDEKTLTFKGADIAEIKRRIGAAD